MESLFQWIWLIPVFPLLGALVNGLFGRKIQAKGKGWVNAVALGSTGLTLLLSLGLVLGLRGLDFNATPAAENIIYSAGNQQVVVKCAEWMLGGEVITTGGIRGALEASWSFTLDPLSSIMLILVTFVGFLIHVFSMGYMAEEKDYARYFAYLNLFMASMLVLILGSSLLVMFVGWEGVGLCSYLLIGFYYKDKTAADAGKKAFLTNRIGDLGFVVGGMLLLSAFGTLDFTEINLAAMNAGDFGVSQGLLTAAALCLFLGACGKSAQLPLYVWLPDAMAGPTPVSALIHAATMVTSGIYMIARLNGLYSQAPSASVVVAVVGGLTAIVAATMALTQTDIKKVLAYSTVSQLGYMMLAMGVGAYSAGVFHLFTHGFFKALLFLGAGSVIMAMHHQQDIRSMGGLRSKLPLTFLTFLIGTLAISGVPPFSGFFSKDEIIWRAFAAPYFMPGLPLWVGYMLWAFAFVAAGLTSFYMFRLLYLVFLGKSRTDEQTAAKIQESPGVMTFPLIILAAGAAGLGFLGVPALIRGALSGNAHPGPNAWESWLNPVLFKPTQITDLGFDANALAAIHTQEWVLLALGLGIAALGWFFAHTLYNRANSMPENLAKGRPGIYAFINNKWYVDEFYQAAVIGPFVALAKVFAFIDRWIIDGAVNLLGLGYQVVGIVLRQMQSGYIRNYGLAFVLGIVFLLLYVVF